MDAKLVLEQPNDFNYNYYSSLLTKQAEAGRNMVKIPVEGNETKRTKHTPLFSDLDDNQLMNMFGGSLRFVLCCVVLVKEGYCVPDPKLFGTIHAEAGDGGFSLDPLLQQHNPSSVSIFNREFNDPIHIPWTSLTLILHDVGYCSLPVSSTSVVQIAAKLYATTDKVDDVEEYTPDDPFPEPLKLKPITCPERRKQLRERARMFDKPKPSLAPCSTEQIKEEEPFIHNEMVSININEAFRVCDDHTFINISDKPDGGAGCSVLAGTDGALYLNYVVFKYAVGAELEVEFITTATAAHTQVTGSVRAYYGKGFEYDDNDYPASDYHIWLLHPPILKFILTLLLLLMLSLAE